MVDLVVIHPGAQHGIYGDLGNRLTAVEPPTWARMLAGYCADRGVEVRISDTEADGTDPTTIAEQIAVVNTKVVAIVVSGHQPSASTQQMVSARAIAGAVRHINPGADVVMLGNHPSALPERTLREEPVDFVADGEGVETIMGILEDKPYQDIPGLVWRDVSNRVIRNPAAKLVEDLDRDLHGNVWDMLPMDRYRSHNWHAFGGWGRQPYASIYTTLGCPYACSFCMINSFQHSNRYRCYSPKFVVDQIEMLHREHDVRMFKIADEMFVLKEAHYLGVANELIHRGLGSVINIWAYARVDTVKPETLATLREAGFRWLALGIESGSVDVRDGANKRLRRGDIVDVVRSIQKADINVIGNFMFGLRDDTAETMNQTLDLAMACLPEFANFYCTMAYPGSRLYEQAIAEGWTLPKTWRGYSQHNDDCRPLDTKHISARDVLAFRDAAFDYFYRQPSYRDLIFRKFGPGAIDDIHQMLKYKLQRKLLA